MPKSAWRKNIEIYRMPIFAIGPPVLDVIIDQKKFLGQEILHDFLLVTRGYDLQAGYIPAKQLRDFIEAILETIKNKPDFVINFQKQGIKDIDKLFNFAKDNKDKDFKKLSDKQLLSFYKEWRKYFKYAEGKMTMTTWFVDSDGEDLSKFLMSLVEEKIKEKNIKISVAEAFSLLTTPDRMSLSMQEEIEALEILQTIKKYPKAKKLFGHQDIKYIENNLATLDSKLKNKIIKHYKKWLWMSYTYIGPPYELDYYITMWSGLLKQGVNVEKNIKDLKNQILVDKQARVDLLKKLGLKGKEKKYFDLAKDIIYIKSFRKDAWFYASYVLESIHREVARRLNLSLKQVRMMTFDELPLALQKGIYDHNVLNKRFKKTVYIFKGTKTKIYDGDEADKFLATQNIEKEIKQDIKSLSGTSARAGQAKGIVKIVNVPEEIGKMEEGNIMVARTTFPSLVPAMKKAAAIVTNDGGITCHAAIVARELKIPCVVGTKIATTVLKDGDMVSVDADKGVVEKI